MMFSKQVRLTYVMLTLLRDWFINIMKMEPRGPTEFPPSSPHIIPLDFYLWGTLENVIYRRKAATLAALREEVEDTFANVA